MPHLSFHLFGAPRLECNGAPVHIVRRRALACAVYLAVTGRETSRETLATLFWPEFDPYHARADLRRTLHLLHQTLGPARLLTEGEHVRLARGDDLWLDIEHFRHLLAACRDHGHAPEQVCLDCLPVLAAAAVLYRDDFLAGFTLPDSPDFDQWQLFEGEQLRRELASALARLVRGHTAQGEYGHAIAYARRWVALDPLDEPAQQWLMRLYAWSGERNAALQQYQLCAQLLAQELDVRPEPATRELEETIRSGRLPPPATAAQLDVVSGRSQRHAPAGGMVPAAEDELRVVTVLCAGCRPAEGEADSVDVQVAQAEQLQALAGAACAAYGGRVQRVPGGDVLALFGLDHIHEDDPERAVRAGLALQEAAQAEGLAVQVGINTGTAYCAHSEAGTGEDAEALLLGTVVNLAARLCDCAGSGQVLAGRAAYRTTRGVFDYTPRELALPGYAQLVTAYRALHVRSHVTKARGVEGLRAPLVGREPEMAQLGQALDRVRGGQGQLVLISGVAGVGKSRLVTELQEAWTRGPGTAVSDLAPGLWLEGRCLEFAAATGYWPFIDIVRHGLGGEPSDDTALAGRLAALLERLAASGDLPAAQVAEIAALLGRLLSLRFGNAWDERGQQIDPRQVRQRTREAICALVTALAHREPVALIFEDLHWADALSVDLIGRLIEALDSAPLLLVCVYRPEQAQAGEPLLALAQQQCPKRCTALHLQELNPDESRRLLAALLSIERLPEPLRGLILSKAQGNPFFLEEIVRSQIDSGLLYRHEDSWRARAELASLAAPQTVQAVILSRVDRLPLEQKQVLQLAAVLGRFFQRRLLAALVPAGRDLEGLLAALTGQALIYQERSLPEPEYSFRHVLVQDAVYQAVPGKRRAAQHRQVAQVMEAEYAGRLNAHVEQLAYHYDRADAAEKAIEYLVAAGEKAQNAYLNDEAIDYYRRALARLDALPQGAWREADRWRLAALRGTGITCWNTSKLADAETHFRCALTLAQQMRVAPLELAQLYNWLCRTLRWQNRPDDVIAVALEGLGRLGDATRTLDAAILCGNLIEGYYHKDELTRYYAVLDHLAGFLTTLPYSDNLFENYGHLILMYRDRNEIEKARELVRLVEQGLQDGHNAILAAWLHMWIIARYLDAIGDTSAAIGHNELGVELMRKLGDLKSRAYGLNQLAVRALSLGQLARARAAIEEGLAVHSRVGSAGEIMESTQILGHVRYCEGAIDEAIDLIERAIEFAHLSRFLMQLRIMRTLLGHLYLRQGRRDEAQTQFRIVLGMETPDPPRLLWMARAMAGLDAAGADPDEFRDPCLALQREHPELGLRQWRLEPATPDIALPNESLSDLVAGEAAGHWQWIDQYGDCSWTQADGALTIHAANCRDLWSTNLSAPRLVRPVMGDFALQVTCSRSLPDRPAIGGLLLWQDRANYLRLTWGELGADQVMLSGALANRNVIIGRGTLANSGSVALRVERHGEQVTALCSADGGAWYCVGQVMLPASCPALVGLCAMGDIDRMVYPGAYPEGTAIAFRMGPAA